MGSWWIDPQSVDPGDNNAMQAISILLVALRSL